MTLRTTTTTTTTTTTLSFRFRERFSVRRRVGCVATTHPPSRRLSRVFFRSRASM